MRFASLGSGSRGNATLVEAGATLLMLDCGFSVRETERRLSVLGCAPERISALLVTHEHGDHLRGVAPLARKYRIPVWLTHGTWQMMRDCALPDVRYCNGHQSFGIGDLRVEPFTVPHDAREPCQFCFSASGRRLGVLTDTGRPRTFWTGSAGATRCCWNAITAAICSRMDHIPRRSSGGWVGRSATSATSRPGRCSRGWSFRACSTWWRHT